MHLRLLILLTCVSPSRSDKLLLTERSKARIPACPISEPGTVATGFRADYVIPELRPGRYRPGSDRTSDRQECLSYFKIAL
jgi:hypothetical protein